MPEPNLTVVAEVTAKPGAEQELKTLLLSILDTVRQEDGCIQYDLHVGNEDPGKFVFYETWKDADALKRHGASPHMREFGARAGGLLSGAPKIVTYTRIG